MDFQISALSHQSAEFAWTVVTCPLLTLDFPLTQGSFLRLWRDDVSLEVVIRVLVMEVDKVADKLVDMEVGKVVDMVDKIPDEGFTDVTE